jgi:hypothetical protein
MTLSIVISLNSTSASVDAFFRTGFVTAFPKVIRLILTCNFDGRQPAPLVEMICLFPALQELRIHDMSGTSAHPPSSAVPPGGLHCLKLGGDSPGPILAWLNMFNHLPNVNSLTLHDPVTNSQLNTVRTALQRLGGSITHLDIALTWLTEFRGTYIHCFSFFLHLTARRYCHDRVRLVAPPKSQDYDHPRLFLGRPRSIRPRADDIVDMQARGARARVLFAGPQSIVVLDLQMGCAGRVPVSGAISASAERYNHGPWWSR